MVTIHMFIICHTNHIHGRNQFNTPQYSIDKPIASSSKILQYLPFLSGRSSECDDNSRLHKSGRIRTLIDMMSYYRKTSNVYNRRVFFFYYFMRPPRFIAFDIDELGGPFAIRTNSFPHRTQKPPGGELASILPKCVCFRREITIG